MTTKKTFSASHSTIVRRVGALFCAASILLIGFRAQAQCLKCSAATESTSCSAADAWGFCCVPGFILADNNADGSASVSMTIGQNSVELNQTFNSDGCCVAPYANIGIFDACQASDQYGQAGSHLPIQLKDIAMLKGAWTFQVPMPLNPDWQVEQYRVYFEMFLSSTAAGKDDSGNITIVFFWNNYGFETPTGHATINGQGMDIIDYGVQGQGPFVDFLFPAGTYAPNSSGVVTVNATDIKAILDYAQTTFPSYYNGNLYLASLSLAEEAGAFHGTVKTSYVSFAIQKTGSEVVYTPAFTANHWSGTGTGGATSTGGASSSTGGTTAKATGGAATGGTKATSAAGGAATGGTKAATSSSASGGSAAGGAVTGGTKAATSTGVSGGSGVGGAATGGTKAATSTSGGSAAGGTQTLGTASGGISGIGGVTTTRVSSNGGSAGAGSSTSGGSTDATSAASKSGSCGCKMPGSPANSSKASWLALGLIGLFGLRSRRKR